MKTTKKDKVLAHLKSGKSLTPLEAFGVYKVTRLSGIVYDLRAEGHRIESHVKLDAENQKYAQYKYVEFTGKDERGQGIELAHAA